MGFFVNFVSSILIIGLLGGLIYIISIGFLFLVEYIGVGLILIAVVRFTWVFFIRIRRKMTENYIGWVIIELYIEFFHIKFLENL